MIFFREEDEFVMGGEDGYSGPSSLGGGRGGRSGGKGRYGKVRKLLAKFFLFKFQL